MVNPVPLVVDGQNPMKRIREVLGLSQVGFAQLLGLDPNAVSRWERGHGTPRFTPGQFKVLLKCLETVLNALRHQRFGTATPGNPCPTRTPEQVLQGKQPLRDRNHSNIHPNPSQPS
jgi:ribosome-binding protein aMBF1 (putative translation factor)